LSPFSRVTPSRVDEKTAARRYRFAREQRSCNHAGVRARRVPGGPRRL